jgi:uncharacterized protein YceH (UPF0502 family)
VRALSPLEARILGVLVEKQATVPDTYPLSLNALVAGCNQKTARDPVMNAGDADVLGALDELKSLSLVVESSGSRVTRYEHNMARALGVPSQSVAVLATLMLRGPQTSAELRANSERLYRFADVSSVEGFLDELSAKSMVVKLARAPGAREARWAHRLCGEVVAPPSADAMPVVVHDSHDALDALRADHVRLAARVDELAAAVQALAARVGPGS